METIFTQLQDEWKSNWILANSTKMANRQHGFVQFFFVCLDEEVFALHCLWLGQVADHGNENSTSDDEERVRFAIFAFGFFKEWQN